MASDKKMFVKSPCKGKVRNSDYVLLKSESLLHQVTRLQFIAKKNTTHVKKEWSKMF